MKKTIIALVTILILSGLIALSIQGTPQQIVNGEKYAYKGVEDKWSIPPAYFKKLETMHLSPRFGSNWGWPPNDNTEIAGQMFDRVKLFYVRFIETSTGNYTEFALILLIPPPPYDPSKITMHDRMEITHNGGMLSVLNYSETDTYGNVHHYTTGVLGGMAKYDGNYTVETELSLATGTKLQNIWVDAQNMTHTEWVDPNPPANLYLYKLTVEAIYPWKSLLVASPVMMVIGVVVFVWSVRKDKGRVAHKASKHPLNMNKR